MNSRTTQKITCVHAAFLPDQCLEIKIGTNVNGLAIGGVCIVSMIESVGRSIANSAEETENLGNVITLLASITLGIFSAIDASTMN